MIGALIGMGYDPATAYRMAQQAKAAGIIPRGWRRCSAGRSPAAAPILGAVGAAFLYRYGIEEDET